MKQREAMISLKPLELPDSSSAEYVLDTPETIEQSYELAFTLNAVKGAGSIAVKEVIQFEIISGSEASEPAENDFLVVNGDELTSLDNLVDPFTDAQTQEIVHDELTSQLMGLEREPIVGPEGPPYDGTDHTDEERWRRYGDWVHGTGRMLDVAWDEGAITEEVLPEWAAYKKRLDTVRGISDLGDLIWAIAELRVEVFEFCERLKVHGEAFEAYVAATE